MKLLELGECVNTLTMVLFVTMIDLFKDSKIECVNTSITLQVSVTMIDMFKHSNNEWA